MLYVSHMSYVCQAATNAWDDVWGTRKTICRSAETSVRKRRSITEIWSQKNKSSYIMVNRLSHAVVGLNLQLSDVSCCKAPTETLTTSIARTLHWLWVLHTSNNRRFSGGLSYSNSAVFKRRPCPPSIHSAEQTARCCCCCCCCWCKSRHWRQRVSELPCATLTVTYLCAGQMGLLLLLT